MTRRGQRVPEFYVPDAVRYLLSWFWTLDSYRELRGEQWAPLSPERVESWARLRGIALRPWEYSLLEDMDVARLSGPAGLSERENLTVDAFDDMFD